MLQYFFKIAWRNFLKGKTYSIINITGLAAGMAVALLIGLWIYDELSFDNYFQKKSRLAQVMISQESKGEWDTDKTIAVPAAAAIRSSFPDDVKNAALVTTAGDYSIIVGGKRLNAMARYVESSFPEMFTLKMIEGSRNTLADPSAIIIAKSLKESLFGNASAMDQVIRVDNNQDLKITGVFEDFPFNTTFHKTTALFSWQNANNWQREITDWSNHSAQLFVELAPEVSLEKTNERIKNIPTSHVKEWHEELLLQPLSKLNLYTKFEKGKAVGGRIQYVWLFGITGIFVLLLACINFMNLATARSDQRSKEVGIRKAVGSLRRQLVVQFLGESLALSFAAFSICLVIVYLALPYFNNFSGKQISLPVTSVSFWLCAIAFTLFTGLISGSYPAFYLSRFKSIQVLKGTFRTGRMASLPRQILVVTQFTVSITLIVGTIVVYQQIQHARSRPVGYTREGLITCYAGPSLEKNFETFRNEVIQAGGVAEMCASSFSPLHFSANNSVDWKGKDATKPVFFRNVNISAEFGKTIGWKVKQGRDFSRQFATDSTAAILSETALKMTGISNPIGETIKFNDKNYTVIGVVNDLITQSPFDPVEPTIYFTDGWKGVFTFRLQPGLGISEAIEKITPVFKKFDPQSPFYYSFVDEEYGKKFTAEQQVSSLATFFAGLAIFISCMGLFGLASFIVQKRIKEISIRKVLGASAFNVWRLLSKDFLILIIISILISTPIAYHFMNNWLANYSYRTNIGWWIFAMTGLGTAILTLTTVSFQTIRAAKEDPAKILKSE